MLIKIKNSEDGKFFFDIVDPKGDSLVASKKFAEKEKCVKIARQIGNAGKMEIGDFTKKRSPVRKPKTEADPINA